MKKILTFVALIVMLLLLGMPIALAQASEADSLSATMLAHVRCSGCAVERCQQGRRGGPANPQCEGCGSDCCGDRRDAPMRGEILQDDRRAVPPPMVRRGRPDAVTGEVAAIETMSHGDQRSADVRMQVKTDTGDITVRLGPAWYLDHQDIQLQTGDYVSVEGTRMARVGESVMIASAVHKGNQVLILRDQEGVPVWRGWRQMRKQGR